MKIAVWLAWSLCLWTASPKQEEPANMKGMVQAHNSWREKVGVPPLTWSPELAAFAQQWADHLAQQDCEMEHRPRSGTWANPYGENIYWAQGMNATPEHVVNSWGSEITNFDTKSGKCKGGVCGHYTQVVWRNSTLVGCGMARCGDREIWVCNYNPPGNWVGEKPY